MGIIYCYTNKINNKKYIGQTINPEQRYKAHKSTAFNPKDQEYNSLLHQAFRKYGYENFQYEILAEAETVEELNGLEIYYIAHFNTQVPNGYNIEAGGLNALKPMKEITKIKLMKAHGSLTEEEVIELRKAYQEHKSPTQIYKEKYSNRLHFQSFLNIWCGKRYKSIMPEVFNNEKRQTKLTEDIVRNIRIDRKNGATYQELMDKYKICKSTIGNICRNETWKSVQI